MLNIDKNQFLLNLRLTQAYCERQLQLGNESDIAVLRSLNPVYGEGRLFNYKPNKFATLSGEIPELVVEWATTADPYNSEFLGELLENQLAQKAVAGGLSYDVAFEGKILAVEYDDDIPDGVAAVESAGFVDEWDFPPIDTWFYRVYGPHSWVLFAWVPGQFVERADAAVEVHFLDIIHWFEDWAPLDYQLVMTSD